MKVYVYPDLDLKWRWHIVARNKKKVATSGESFHSRANATRAAKTFVRNLYSAHISGSLTFVVSPK